MELLLKKWSATMEILFPTILLLIRYGRAINVDGRQLPREKTYL
jgi:hypothetical protein